MITQINQQKHEKEQKTVGNSFSHRQPIIISLYLISRDRGLIMSLTVQSSIKHFYYLWKLEFEYFIVPLII